MKKVLVTLLILLSLGAYAEKSDAPALQLSLTPDIALHEDDVMIKGVALNIWGENPQRSLNLGFVNGSTGHSSGVSFAFFVNYAENYTGAQIAGVNYNAGNFKGAQLGFANYAENLEKGVQLGFVNYAETMTKGLQLGLVNIIRNNDKWFEEFPDNVAPAMVFVNWRF